MTGALVAEVALLAAALPVALASAYLLVLVLLSRRNAPPRYAAEPTARFDVVVPAHDEAAGIAGTVASVLAVDYPRELFRVLVVADNCSDDTAERARAAGACVLVRDEPERRGKGYALAHAFASSLRDGQADAVVVVDADTSVTPNLLRAFAARLEAGASAVQANNVVRNAGAAWRTGLMAIAFVLFNTLRSVGRERLRCSAGLRGNGMCLSTRLLRQVPHEVFSVVEDLEYGIRIGLAGHRVHFAGEAAVRSDMVAGADASRSQRRRWELGRARMARRHGLALLGRGLALRNRVLVDLGVDLLVPPLAFLAATAIAGAVISSSVSWAAGRPLVAAWAWSGSVAALAIYVVRGWWMSGTGLRGLIGLLHAPIYLVWKLALAMGKPASPPDAWIRTDREGRS